VLYNLSHAPAQDAFLKLENPVAIQGKPDKDTWGGRFAITDANKRKGGVAVLYCQPSLV
jgi:hypothetical protein